MKSATMILAVLCMAFVVYTAEASPASQLYAEESFDEADAEVEVEDVETATDPDSSTTPNPDDDSGAAVSSLAVASLVTLVLTRLL